MSEELEQALVEVRHRAEKAVEVALLPHFTDHSITHLDRVAQSAMEITARNRKSDACLSQDELFVLLAAAYLHDVGLQSTGGISGKVGELTAKQLVEIRQLHPRVAHNWVLQSLTKNSTELEELGVPELGVNYNQRARGLMPYVAKLCLHHSGSLENVSLPTEEHAGKPLRLRLLLHILRLADALDLDERRVRMDRLNLWRLSPSSLFHWWRHHYVTSVAVKPHGEISIKLTFPPELSRGYVDRFVQLVRQEVERELVPAQELFHENEIFLYLAPLKYSQEFGQARRPLPAELVRYIDELDKPREDPLAGQLETPTGKLTPAQRGKSWISYWGFKGNPWTDLPLSYRDEEFVITDDLAVKLDELDQLVQGDKGEIRFVFGTRGAGKTTFVQSVRDRYAEKGRISFIDLSRTIGTISTAADLYSRIYPKILEDLGVQNPPDEPDAKDMRAAIEQFRTKKPIIIIDNLDRYTEKPDLRLIRHFFALSQGNLQALKRKAVLVISATDEWRSDLEAANLNYLGKASFWDLGRFSPEDVEQLIRNRLAISNSSYDHVFEEGAARLIRQISEGIPRLVLTTCESLCQRGAQDGVPKITQEFIHQIFGRDLKDNRSRLIHNTAKKSPDLKDGLERIYAFHVLSEKVDILIEDAWHIFGGLAQGDIVPTTDIPPRLLDAVRKVAVPKVGRNDGSPSGWAIHPSVKTFIAALRKEGLSAVEFVASYKARPVSPPGVDREAIENEVRRVVLTDRAEQVYETARRLFLDSQNPDASPQRVLTRARFCLEYLIVALLMKRGVALPEDYLLGPEPGYFENHRGQKRQKFPTKLRKELQGLIRAFEQSQKIRLNSYREVRFIQKKSEDVLRDDAKATKLADTDAGTLRGAIKAVYEEFTILLQEKGP